MGKIKGKVIQPLILTISKKTVRLSVIPKIKISLLETMKFYWTQGYSQDTIPLFLL